MDTAIGLVPCSEVDILITNDVWLCVQLRPESYLLGVLERPDNNLFLEPPIDMIQVSLETQNQV